MPKRTEPPTRPPSSRARFEAMVDALAPQVDLWRAMLTDHTRDPRGFCAAKVCREPGTGRPYLTHPCPTRVLALRAQQQHRGQP